MEVINNSPNNKSPKVKKKRKSSAGKGLSPLNNVKKVNNKVQQQNGVTKASSTANAVNVACLEGINGPELQMVRRLAGNDPMVRKKTMRKLRKWLNVLSQKVPDSPESREMIEPNFIRVWKALFYCMWMADKPLPQEQLAESISELQNIFAPKTGAFLLFVEWFLRTMAREWAMIDRFRMDKYMMLFRRFLRKTLLIIDSKKWHNDALEGFLKILAVHIFNRHPPSKPKKHLPPPPPPITAPLGLQIHFTDIFMEELAKVGGYSLKFQKILKVLTVFIHELGHSSDDRLLDEIRERIFNHLMRQSDVGMDYEEERAFGGVLPDDEEEEEDEVETDGEETEENLGEEDQYFEDEAENDVENGVLDPRAGAVDVILPQLDIDYQKLYETLVKFGGQKEIKLKNRRILYSLASQFKEITEGKYPLALPEDEGKKPAIDKKQIKKAAQALVDLDMEEGLTGKKRKSKKQRKREAKKARLNQSADSAGSEDNSEYIQDEDLLEHVSDNYMSYLEEGMGEEEPEVEGGEEEETEVDVEVEEKKKKKGKKEKSKKAQKRKWKTEVEVEEAEEEDDEEPPTLVPAVELVPQEETIVVKRPKMNKRASLGNVKAVSELTPLRGKVKRLSELRTPQNKGSPLNSSLTASGSKRVSFVLARNKEHEHADYPVSIARSPAIPFDKHKIPNAGLLKSPIVTPKSTPIRRAAALDFF